MHTSNSVAHWHLIRNLHIEDNLCINEKKKHNIINIKKPTNSKSNNKNVCITV